MIWKELSMQEMNITSSIINVLIAVAFITLTERKILGSIQWRKGPNKVKMKGITQPIMDAIKLMSKESIKHINTEKFMFMIMPIGMMTMTLMIIMFIQTSTTKWNKEMYNMMMILCIMSMMSYPVIMGSWFSGTLYSKIGSMRAVAQLISYEVSMILIMMMPITITESTSIEKFSQYKTMMMMNLPLTMMMMISILAETNRTPTDLVEGESELVAGFTTEFNSKDFTMIFVAEYMMIMSWSLIMSFMLMPNESGSASMMLSSMMIMCLILWTRSMLPRMRYDELMNLCWSIILPSSIMLMMNSINMKLMMEKLIN